MIAWDPDGLYDFKPGWIEDSLGRRFWLLSPPDWVAISPEDENTWPTQILEFPVLDVNPLEPRQASPRRMGRGIAIGAKNRSKPDSDSSQES